MVIKIIVIIMKMVLVRTLTKMLLPTNTQVTLLANILLSLFFSTLDSNRQCPTLPGSVLCWTPV